MGLEFVWQPYPYVPPSIKFLFVGAEFCFKLPSDSLSPRTPLPSANTSHCRACSGLPPPSCYPCRAHQIKNLGNFTQILLFIYSVIITGPSFVTMTVCSICATKLFPFVVYVQPSPSSYTSSSPVEINGSNASTIPSRRISLSQGSK